MRTSVAFIVVVLGRGESIADPPLRGSPVWT
jgi:hypothetical protein